MPHYVPEPEGPPIGLMPVLLQYITDSDTSDEERFPDDFSSSSASSIEPSEPEHEPSLELSASASSSSGVDGLKASIAICYGQNQYLAEEECLLVVVYVDDVLRVPLPGWPREDIQAIVLGLSGDWTTFSAIIERDRPPQEALPSLVLEPLAELSTETALALENVAAPVTEEARGRCNSTCFLVWAPLIVGGGIVLGGTVFAVVVWVESVELGPTSWVVLARLGSVLYRSVRAVLVLLRRGLSALPSAFSSHFLTGNSANPKHKIEHKIRKSEAQSEYPRHSVKTNSKSAQGRALNPQIRSTKSSTKLANPKHKIEHKIRKSEAQNRAQNSQIRSTIQISKAQRQKQFKISTRTSTKSANPTHNIEHKIRKSEAQNQNPQIRSTESSTKFANPKQQGRALNPQIRSTKSSTKSANPKHKIEHKIRKSEAQNRAQNSQIRSTIRISKAQR